VRPLDFLGSIKLKLGVVIVAAVVVTVVVVAWGRELGLPSLVTAVVAAVLALALVQLLAHGMTYPLREMVAAARAMARGDYSRRVTATSRDEVGELARAFNAMATELEQIDRVRRDLVANASHELRTPIGALQARLENLVDGVEAADQQALGDLLGQVQRLADLTEQLLDLSRLESGAVPLEYADLDARELLDRIATEWRPRAAERGVRVDVEPLDFAVFQSRSEHGQFDALGLCQPMPQRFKLAAIFFEGGTFFSARRLRMERTISWINSKSATFSASQPLGSRGSGHFATMSASGESSKMCDTPESNTARRR